MVMPKAGESCCAAIAAVSAEAEGGVPVGEVIAVATTSCAIVGDVATSSTALVEAEALTVGGVA